jgi:hypothetical protein
MQMINKRWWTAMDAGEFEGKDATSASRNGKTSTYSTTGSAAAAHYGFVNGGANNVSVHVTSVTCPGDSDTCYKATISQTAPQFFSAIWHGPYTLSATAYADPTVGSMIHPYCLLALAHNGSPATGILADGVPHADMTGCGIMSNTGMTCNGHNLNATWGDAHGTNGGSAGCGNIQNSNVATVSDPYAHLASNIPTTGNACPATWSGSVTLHGNTICTGTVTLTGNVTLTTDAPGSVLVIKNVGGGGDLNSNGYTITNDYSGANGLTVILTGSTGQTPGNLTGGGTFAIIAPTSGTWSGMAVYQDPGLTTSQSVTYAGNSPTWDITGAVDMPYVSLTFKGAVGKTNNGAACFVLVANDVTFKGTGDIESNGGCAAAGLGMPQDTLAGTPALVQ